jgi:thiamine-monophosphate kinase
MVGRTVGDGAADLALIRRDLPQSSDQSAPPNPGDPPNPTDLPNPAERALLRAHLEPVPQVELGRWLARNHLATAMIDLSDGVLADLGHICEASGVGAELITEKLPLSPQAKTVAKKLGADPVDWALHGGEDYCLLFCVSPKNAPHIAARGKQELNLTLTRIGTIDDGPAEVRVQRSGRPNQRSSHPSPFKHF